MKFLELVSCFVIALLPVGNVFAEDLPTLGGLDQPVKLTTADLQQLMPEAHMGRLSSNGNTQMWSNDLDGSFVLSDMKSTGKSTTAHGKWHVSDDARYCVVIEWKGSVEEWCRLVFKTTDGYYLAKSDKFPTEKVYKFDIKAK